MAFKSGQKVTMKSVKSYESSETSKVGKTRTGTFYIWSAATKNGRIRITNKKSYVGKNPAGKYVTCWVKTSSIKSGSAKKTTKKKKKSTAKKTKNPSTSPSSKKNTKTTVNISEASNVTPKGTTPGQIGYLGQVLFVVSDTMIKTLDGFTMSESAKYVEHDRHMKDPILEFTGAESTKITFKMMLSRYLGASVWSDYNTLKKYMTQGIAIPLKIGKKNYGSYRWCVQSLGFKGLTTDKDGNWTSAEVSISLISTVKKDSAKTGAVKRKKKTTTAKKTTKAKKKG